jgi:hypothetical protein
MGTMGTREILPGQLFLPRCTSQVQSLLAFLILTLGQIEMHTTESKLGVKLWGNKGGTANGRVVW